MKGYYKLPKFVQWIFAIVLLIGGTILLSPYVTKPYGILILPVLAPLLNLVTVPFFKLIGIYKYLNPYVLSTVQSNKKYDLHNIFSFDYLVNFKWADRGKVVQKTLLGHYCKALLTIIERIENKELSDQVQIVGHSYFFNTKTAEKLGFTVSKASIFWIINSALQFIELSYLYSFSQGRWAFPKFWKVKKAEIIGSDLVLKKEVLQQMANRLLRDLSDK